MKSEFNFPILIKASTTIRKSHYLEGNAEQLKDLFLGVFEPHSLGTIHSTSSDAFAFIGEPFRLTINKWNKLRDFSYGEVKVLDMEDRWVVSFIGEPRRIFSTSMIYALSLSCLFTMASRDVVFGLIFGFSVGLSSILINLISSKYRMKRFLDRARHRMMLDR